MNPSLIVPIGLVLAMVLSGCASAPTASSGQATATPAGPADKPRNDDRPPLTVGMPASEVRRLWGDPVKIEPVSDPQLKVEVWIYEGRVTERTTPVATTTREVMSYNPIFEGGVVPTIVNVYSIQTRRIAELHHVVIVGDKVADVFRSQRELPVEMR